MYTKIIFRNLSVFFSLLLLCVNLRGQENSKYFVQFTDKKNSPFSIAKPEQFLSERALQRRIRNYVPITEQDIPVVKAYIDSIESTGVTVQYSSKWFNSVTIDVPDESVIEKIRKFSFVKIVQKTADAKLAKSAFKNKFDYTIEAPLPGAKYYGRGYTQIKLENGNELHNKGFMGKGVQIAIADNGFLNADTYTSLSILRNYGRILGTRSFVHPGENVYRSGNHGAMVLTTIAADIPETFVGTAPEASFWLMHTENESSEFPAEEDNWVAGAEFADSVGADIISTSLGYSEFENRVYDHTYSDMNGKTTRVSIGAGIAASKGIVVVVSAGNEGNMPWRYISAPADAIGILSVGAVTSDSTKVSFSSLGPSSDGRVKPEIMGMGTGVTAEVDPGNFSNVSGTSFSCPINSGLVACLIQAFPAAKSKEIIDAIIRSSSYFGNPNDNYGYGIPDYNVAFSNLENTLNPKKEFSLSPNPFKQYLVLNSKITTGTVIIKCFNSIGKLQFESVRLREPVISLNNEIANLIPGFYIFSFTADNKTTTIKAIKLRTPESYK